MIYGYTFNAPWIGNHTILYCKNVYIEAHNDIWRLLFVKGGNYLILGCPEHYAFDIESKLNYDTNPDAAYCMIQYGGPSYIINKIIVDFNIQILARFNQDRKREDELAIISEMDLAIKLEN